MGAAFCNNDWAIFMSASLAEQNRARVRALFLEAAISRLKLWHATGSVDELRAARANIDSILDLEKADIKPDMRCM